jgi:hypothetical protein
VQGVKLSPRTVPTEAAASLASSNAPRCRRKVPEQRRQISELEDRWHATLSKLTK